MSGPSSSADVLPGASALDDQAEPAPDKANRWATATQRQLIWWRFKRHKLAMASLVVVILFYAVAALGDFLATQDPHATDSRTSYIAPQAIHLWDDGSFRPHVYGLKGVRDPKTFRIVYTPDP